MEEVRLQEEVRQLRRELLLLYEIGNLIRSSLLLDEVIYLILSAVTSHEGMGFNRAILFMVNDIGTHIEGKMGIGPANSASSPAAWKMIKDSKITLEGLLDVYHKTGKLIDKELNDIVHEIRIPITKEHGILPRVIIHDAPYLVSREDTNRELADFRLKSLGVSQFAVVPLRGKERTIGALMVDNIATKKDITELEVRRLMMLANHGGLALENAKSYSEVVVTAQQDSLTKLWNHGHFQKLLQESIKDAKITKKDVSLIIFDVDDFKIYNDTLGHQAGDKALEFIARVSKTVMRRHDYLARYGGEEFAAVLPGTSKEEAVKLAERLRSVIERETSNTWQTQVPRKITVSLGVAALPQDADDKEKLIFCADGALYEAKRACKNQVQPYTKTSCLSSETG